MEKEFNWDKHVDNCRDLDCYGCEVEDEEVDEQLCIHGVHDDSDKLCRDCWEADMDDMLYNRMKEE